MIFTHKQKKDFKVPGIITLTQSKVESSLVLHRDDHQGSIEISSEMLSLASRSSSYISEDSDPYSSIHAENNKMFSICQDNKPNLEVIKEIEEEEKRNDGGLTTLSNSKKFHSITAEETIDEGRKYLTKKATNENPRENVIKPGINPAPTSKSIPTGCDYLLACCHRGCANATPSVRVAPDELNHDLLFKDQIYNLNQSSSSKLQASNLRVLPSEKLTNQDILNYLNNEKESDFPSQIAMGIPQDQRDILTRGVPNNYAKNPTKSQKKKCNIF